ncbi:MAG TPA: Mur ligase family protein, partial [Candidatus Mcinerneyibacteriales bacterium]|nr:Mur ligase family protein [Candidatus Mcinerneyibacteriales bacterium]
MSRDGILIIGCGISGLAAARLALRKGWKAYVTERQRTPALEGRFQQLEELGIPYETENTDRFFSSCRLAVLSPGIDPRSPYIQRVKEEMPLIGELEFAYRSLSPGKRLIAVTGTNGKSTTVSLIRHLLEGQGHSAAAVGNIGLALSDYTDSSHTFLVCEVSSYQLETVETFRPETAVITNITPDHLDRYGGSFEA